MVNDLISAATLTNANQVNARVDLILTQPETSPVSSTGFMLIPNGTANISASSSIPFTTQTAFAPSNGGASYELGNVSVTINGRAAPLLSVSPTQITFIVPNDLAGGLADIIVTSREGYISHSTASVSGLNPIIFAQAGNSSGQGAILDALSFFSEVFSITSPAQLLGLDTRTRLSIWASGISTGVTNTNFSNDVWLSNGQMLENLAESVTVEARTADGRVFSLPVEYAGVQGSVPGLDQVNAVLVPELGGAGQVQLTIIVAGQRGNTRTIIVQ
jgi:uncharacterized protein (TIGR03437 family)